MTLATANTAQKIRHIANHYGWQVEEDNNSQLIIYTGEPEGAPQLAQEAAAIYGWDYDSDNYGSIILYTDVYAPDIRLCSVWIEYTDSRQANTEVWLDIDSSIEEQVYASFNPIDPEYPQIANFRWDLVREVK